MLRKLAKFACFIIHFGVINLWSFNSSSFYFNWISLIILMHHKSKVKFLALKDKKEHTCFAKPLMHLTHLQIHIKFTAYQQFGMHYSRYFASNPNQIKISHKFHLIQVKCTHIFLIFAKSQVLTFNLILTLYNVAFSHQKIINKSSLQIFH